MGSTSTRAGLKVPECPIASANALSSELVCRKKPVCFTLTQTIAARSVRSSLKSAELVRSPSPNVSILSQQYVSDSETQERLRKQERTPTYSSKELPSRIDNRMIITPPSSPQQARIPATPSTLRGNLTLPNSPIVPWRMIATETRSTKPQTTSATPTSWKKTTATMPKETTATRRIRPTFRTFKVPRREPSNPTNPIPATAISMEHLTNPYHRLEWRLEVAGEQLRAAQTAGADFLKASPEEVMSKWAIAEGSNRPSTTRVGEAKIMIWNSHYTFSHPEKILSLLAEIRLNNPVIIFIIEHRHLTPISIPEYTSHTINHSDTRDQILILNSLIADTKVNEQELQVTIEGLTFSLQYFKPTGKDHPFSQVADIVLGDLNSRSNKKLMKDLSSNGFKYTYLDPYGQCLGLVSKHGNVVEKVESKYIRGKTGMPFSDHPTLIATLRAANLRWKFKKNNLDKPSSWTISNSLPKIYFQDIETTEAQWIWAGLNSSRAQVKYSLDKPTLNKYMELFQLRMIEERDNLPCSDFRIFDKYLQENHSDIIKAMRGASRTRDIFGFNTQDFLGAEGVRMDLLEEAFKAKQNISRIVFLQKKDNIPFSYENSRPISIIPAYIKGLEYCLKKKITNLMEKAIEQTGMFQFGFRQHVNTSTLLIELQNRDPRNILNMDIRKAYDYVPAILVDQALTWLGAEELRIPIAELMEAKVYINGMIFKKNRGLPQGSTLSPALFNICLAYLFNQLNPRTRKTILAFADNLTIVDASADQEKDIIRILSTHFIVNTEKTERITALSEGELTNFPKYRCVNESDLLGVKLTLRLKASNRGMRAHIAISEKNLIFNKIKANSLRFLTNKDKLRVMRAKYEAKSVYLLARGNLYRGKSTRSLVHNNLNKDTNKFLQGLLTTTKTLLGFQRLGYRDLAYLGLDRAQLTKRLGKSNSQYEQYHIGEKGYLKFAFLTWFKKDHMGNLSRLVEANKSHLQYLTHATFLHHIRIMSGSHRLSINKYLELIDAIFPILFRTTTLEGAKQAIISEIRQRYPIKHPKGVNYYFPPPAIPVREDLLFLYACTRIIPQETKWNQTFIPPLKTRSLEESTRHHVLDYSTVKDLQNLRTALGLPLTLDGPRDTPCSMEDFSQEAAKLVQYVNIVLDLPLVPGKRL